MADFKPGCRAEVKEAYRSMYAQPIQMRAGEDLSIGDKESEYPGWVWCLHAGGRSGWVPQQYLEIKGREAKALCDYDAAEMTAAVGEMLTLHLLESGWYWAEKENAEMGWIPAEQVNCLG